MAHSISKPLFKAPEHPSHFYLQDLVEIISPVFPYATSPFEQEIDIEARQWYKE
jgi:hypothetical protein